ncbi:MAG: Gfo/Idh/MocA family oxidoreductase [Lentisphaerae bacterium]|nr:Gfo/Idh/MocA family oxidoreductase [Lentisphaerota bacterium]
MRKVKFGIIGTGAIATMHAQALQNSRNAELVAVYDQITERAQQFAEKYNVRAVTDFESFLADKEVEAVTIATPTGIHGKVAVPAALAGKHILCEKPLDVTTGKVDEIIDACQKTGVILMSVFQSRFVKNVGLIKQAIEANRFGKIVLASAQCKWFRDQKYYDSATWRGTWALDGGGALMNQSIHTIDLLLYLNGDVEEVSAITGTLSHTGIEVEDNAVAIVKFKNGALGTIEGSTSCAPGFPRRVEISGTLGSVVMEDNKIIRWQFVNDEPGDEDIRKNCGIGEVISGGGAGDPMAISSEGHRVQIEDLADAIIEGAKEVKLSGLEGRRAVELICSIYEAARTGQPVKLKGRTK